jgi:uncharacterized protein (DUF2236 family)
MRQPEHPQPPPPGGILWSVAGDVRLLLMLPAAFTLQVAHPVIAAGVDEHSVFRTDPWGRGVRSVESVQKWVYAGEEAAAEGRRVRALHRGIKGRTPAGRAYHSLDPDCYTWVHESGFAVFRYALPMLWGRPLTPAEERALFAEWLQVGRVLGIRDRDMPQTVEEYGPYYRRILTEELARTAVAAELVATDLPLPAPDRGPRAVRLLLRTLWPVLRRPFLRLRAFVTAGYMPPDARAALRLDWTPAQERRLRRLSRAAALLVPLLPEGLRYLPIARRARAEWIGAGRPRRSAAGA